jgi:uncharacterized DUF497 family protein
VLAKPRLSFWLDGGFLCRRGRICADLKMESVMKFEWDEVKAASNLKKHGVDFEEAKTVFDDELANIFNDEWNSVGEQRELIIGTSNARSQYLVIETICKCVYECTI